jgi:hypothetical protein
MKKIGSLTPTITSPETMAEQCQFELLFAHGGRNGVKNKQPNGIKPSAMGQMVSQ